MKKTMIAWLILSVLLVGTLTFIGIRYQNSVIEYNTLEQDLVEAARVYVDVNEITVKNSKTLRIEAKKLIEEKMIDDLKIENDTCEGYVLVKKRLIQTNYEAYIKCKEYTSIDYNQ